MSSRPLANINNWTSAECGAFLILGLIVFLFLLFPSDGTWINDDPALIHEAVAANRQGHPARSGLTGTFDIPEGPVPIQIYQVMLLFTHNPILLMTAHILVIAGVTGLALLSLGRTLQLPLWYGLVLLLSPWQWLLSRSLWDNSFNIPLGAASIASYAAFLTNGKKKWLVSSIACALVMSFVHFMALPLVAALFVHILYKNFRAVWASRYWLIVIVLAVFIIEAPYLKRVAEIVSNRVLVTSRPPAIENVHSSRLFSVDAFFFPLRGGWLFSAQDFPLEWQTAPRWLHRGMDVLVVLSLIGYAIVFFGIVFAMREYIPGRQRGSTIKVRTTVLGISLLALVFQMVYYGIIGIMPLRHYFDATFIIFAIFAWLAIADIPHRIAQIFAGGIHGAAMAGVIVYLAVRVHATGAFGPTPTLGVQRRVAYQLAQYSNTTATTDIEFFEMYPHCLWALIELEGLSKGNIRAEYLSVHKSNPNSDRFSVIVDTMPPASAAGLDVLPLVGDIHPR
jgi:hypothetical protein